MLTTVRVEVCCHCFLSSVGIWLPRLYRNTSEATARIRCYRNQTLSIDLYLPLQCFGQILPSHDLSAWSEPIFNIRFWWVSVEQRPSTRDKMLPFSWEFLAGWGAFCLITVYPLQRSPYQLYRKVFNRFFQQCPRPQEDSGVQVRILAQSLMDMAFPWHVRVPTREMACKTKCLLLWLQL